MQNTDLESSINNLVAKDPEQQNSIIIKKYTKKSSKDISTKYQQELNNYYSFKFFRKIADVLKLNYSSAKSLIHYYKYNKRPIPFQVADVLNGKKPCPYKSMQNNQNAYNNLKIEVWLKNSFIKAYNFFERMKMQEQCFGNKHLS